MKSVIAKPRSRNDIRKLTKIIRDCLNLGNELFFPVIKFLEIVMPQIDDDFSFEVVPIDQMDSCYGMTFPENSCIMIREDVYERAIQGNPRDRFTIAHEIGHYFLHKPGMVAHARVDNEEQIAAYKNPEWQANTFAGELLAPSNLIKGLNVEDVSELCGVSLTAARIQMKNT